MVYRRLGKTGLMVSEISLGGSPISPEPVFAKAVEMGVNYADTSAFYSAGNSERTIGKMMKGRRDKFHVATKFKPLKITPFTKEGVIREAEKSLKRLDSDYIDIFMIHAASKPEHVTHEAVLAGLAQLKKDGKIRFAGASLHGQIIETAKALMNCGCYEVFNVPYNAYARKKLEKGRKYDDTLKRTGIEELLALAKKNDIGVVAMKSMAGGQFQKLDRYLTGTTTLPQAKLKWILENDAVGTIITEMPTFDILEENLAVVGTGLTRRERHALLRYVKATSHLHCRMCGTCQEHCPNGIASTDIQRFLGYHDGHGKRQLARSLYAALPPRARASHCRNCGKCEEVCPYGVVVRERLRRAEEVLS